MDERDIARLAQLHVSCLDDSLVGALGTRYVQTFYRYVTRSEREFVVVERNPDGVIVAAAVLSLEPASLNRRLLVHTPCVLSAIGRIHRLLAMLVRSARRPRGEAVSGAAPATSTDPEMILMFTAPGERRKGFGAVLLLHIERRLRQLSVSVYQVRTLSDPANQALAFYRGRAFTPSGVSFRLGTCFQVFSRTLDPEP